MQIMLYKKYDDVMKKCKGADSISKNEKNILVTCGMSKVGDVGDPLKNRVRSSVSKSGATAYGDADLVDELRTHGTPIRLGIDIGGTNTKFGIVENGRIVFKSKIKTDLSSAEALSDGIAAEFSKIGKKCDFEFVGVGVPGTVAGGIVTADNLPLDGTPLKSMLEQRLGTRIKIENDANCAGLAEVKYGAGRRYQSVVMLTLGTGIGGSIAIGGKLMLGNGNMAELGHMIIQAFGGRECPCGQSGCFEQYASVTALVRMAKESIDKNAGSILAQMYHENGGKLNGKVIFTALDTGCSSAKAVIEEYTGILAVGIDSLINILDPDAVVLSGGITEHGDRFIGAVQRKIHFKTPVVISDLKGDAGIVGAAYLTDLE